MHRRKLLKMGAAGLAVSVAGCSGDDGSGGDSGGGDANNGGGSGDGGSGGAQGPNDVELLEHEFAEQDFGVAVKGRAENVSGGELSYVEAEAVFLDADGVQIGEGLDNVTDLADGRVWEFDCMYLGDADASEIDEYEIGVSTGL